MLLPIFLLISLLIQTFSAVKTRSLRDEKLRTENAHQLLISKIEEQSFGIISSLNSKMVRSPKLSASSLSTSSATAATYYQVIGHKKGNCEGTVMYGVAYLANTCNLLNVYDGTSIYYDISNWAPSRANMTFYIDSACSGQQVGSYEIPYDTDSCDATGDTAPKSVKLLEVSTPYWPTGAGYALSIHASESNCKNAAMPTSQFYNMFGTCTQIYDPATGVSSNFTVSSCSSNSFDVNLYDNDMCSGTPYEATKLKSSSECSKQMEHYGFLGYPSLTCYAGTAHNKCYNAFAVSTPPCSLTMTKSSLKFTCDESGYSGCAISSKTSKETSELFACCTL